MPRQTPHGTAPELYPSQTLPERYIYVEGERSRLAGGPLRQRCLEHIRNGDLRNELIHFWMQQADLRTADMEGELRYRLECSGERLGHCTLIAVQYDAAGERLS